jgi:YD repeat-containing protein
LRDGQVFTATFDAANRLTEDEDACYAYDLNGNMTSRTGKLAGVCSGAVTTYVYDAENRMTRIDLPGGSIALYAYDGLGRRIRKDIDGTITAYVYDSEDILYEFDGLGATLARYTHGPGIDEPLAMQRDLDASGSFEPAETRAVAPSPRAYAAPPAPRSLSDPTTPTGWARSCR